MRTITLMGTVQEISHLQGLIQHDDRLPKEFNNTHGSKSGTTLVAASLYMRGFDRHDFDGNVRWINDQGIIIYEESELYRSDQAKPFAFTTYVTADVFQDFSIKTVEQLELLVFALSGKKLEIIRHY